MKDFLMRSFLVAGVQGDKRLRERTARNENKEATQRMCPPFIFAYFHGPRKWTEKVKQRSPNI